MSDSTPKAPLRSTHPWTALGSVYIPPPQAPSNRSFGLTVGGVLIGIAALLAWRGRMTRAEVVGAIGAMLMIAALVRPASLTAIAAGWGRIGHALGWFNSRVLLTVMFVFIMWPIGLLSRLFGSDPLEQRTRTQDSFWHPYGPRIKDSKHYERQF